MKQHTLILTALFFSTTNCLFLRRIGEDVHNAVNSVFPHEHRILPLGKWHHHHHSSEEDGFHGPGSQEHHHGFRKGPPHHRHPEHDQDCHHEVVEPTISDKNEEVEPATTVVEVETTTVEQQVDVTEAECEEW